MEERFWQAIVSCDQSYDGKFFYGVKTTKIFCRPSCKSRTPKREHTHIFLYSQDALHAGFRPCKRCQPHNPHWNGTDHELVERVKSLIHLQYSESLTLSNIAESVLANPYHLHRVFKRQTGMTPAEYLLKKRISVAKDLLEKTNMRVTDIALAVGFNNVSYFSTVFHRKTSYTPMTYRALHLPHKRCDL